MMQPSSDHLFTQFGDIIASEISCHLKFSTTAMHAYAHQWVCQLVYNPRLQQGLGLTNGEGVERLWSRLRNLIGITRGSGVRAHPPQYIP